MGILVKNLKVNDTKMKLFKAIIIGTVMGGGHVPASNSGVPAANNANLAQIAAVANQLGLLGGSAGSAGSAGAHAGSGHPKAAVHAKSGHPASGHASAHGS